MSNPTFKVTIKFTDGEYRNRATAETSERALHMALVDARMGSPFDTFRGAVVSSEAVPV